MVVTLHVLWYCYSDIVYLHTIYIHTQRMYLELHIEYLMLGRLHCLPPQLLYPLIRVKCSYQFASVGIANIFLELKTHSPITREGA